jgi:hypothetical protein
VRAGKEPVLELPGPVSLQRLGDRAWNDDRAPAAGGLSLDQLERAVDPL